MGEPQRPVIDEKRAYVARATQERWIVPLLDGAIRAALVAHAREGGGAAALDVGCGGQPFRAELERRGYRYFGLDAVAAPGVTPDFLAPIDGELPRACLERGPYPLILCTEVLEHVLDWTAAMRNLHALLAPGGTLIVTCPFVYPLHEEPYDFWRPTAHGLAKMAERAGFRIVEQRRLGDGWDVLGTMIGACRARQIGRGPVAWALTKAARLRRKWAVRVLSSELVRSRVAMDGGDGNGGTVYLSNLVVLTR